MVEVENSNLKVLFQGEGWERGCGSDKWTVKRLKESLIFFLLII